MIFRLVWIMVLGFLAPGTVHSESIKPAPNGIEQPAGYENWRIIGVSQREDNESLRVILGNYAAVKAARSGNTNPWPDGVILAKLVWKDRQHPLWETAIVPGDLVHTEFMIRNKTRYAATGGWGFARWKGMDQKPYGKDASFAQECYGCHTRAEKEDFVFTIPAPLPR